MGEVPPQTMDEPVRVPVPRDPPLPPGYVDPLDGIGALDDLHPVDLDPDDIAPVDVGPVDLPDGEDEPSTKGSKQPPTR